VRDLISHCWRGAAGERDCLRLAQAISGSAQLPIAGTEIVPPFGDAVSLIDYEQPRLNTVLAELEAEAIEPLRRDIEQPERSLNDGLAHCLLLRWSQAAVEACGRESPSSGGINLILHKRD
jgi:hypothetical protein